LFSALGEDISVDLGIASTRRIRSSDGAPLPGLRIAELDATSTQRLIRLLATHERIQLTREQAESLSRYVAGYPPAANFAIQEAKVYGVAHVVENQRTLVEFNERAFLSSLISNKKISPTMQSILQALSAFSPLPREVLVELVEDASDDSFDDALSALIDFVFVVPSGTHYRITAPIRDAAYRRLNGLRVDASRIVQLLESFLAENDDDDARLELGETLFRAATLSGKVSAGAVNLARDLIEITTQSYYDQNYDRVLEIGQRAIDARPNNVDVRRVVAQALIRREHFSQAEEHIAHVTALGALKEAFYIRGFLERNRRDYQAAIAAYKRSIEYGRRGVAVHRELATCYFHLDLLEDAKREVRLAEQADSHNVYVLDLKCTIAMRSGDEEGVRRALDLLSRLDAGSFYPHRRSTYELSHGNIEDALKYARIATDNENRPVFETIANLANCQIEAGLISDAADALLELDTRFSNIRRDTRLGLHCKLELRRGDAYTAEVFWKQIGNKELPVHRALRLNTLRIFQASRDLTDTERAEFVDLSAILDEARAKKLLLGAGALSNRD
jgi:tetratricopeptide (TPR) repeat protein